jgi:hypothetical protein
MNSGGVLGGTTKKRKLKRPSLKSEAEEQRFNPSYSYAPPEITQEYIQQPHSPLLQLPAEIRQSIISRLFQGVSITLANARTLDLEGMHSEEIVGKSKALAEHRPNILRVTAVCKQLRAESWRLLRLRKFKAQRLGDIIKATDAAPLLARIEHLSIHLDGCWAFYGNYAQPRFSSLRSISTRCVVIDYYDGTHAIAFGLEHDSVIDRINAAFAPIGAGRELCTFHGSVDAQWAAYKKSIDVYARVEFRRLRSSDFSAAVSMLHCLQLNN